MEIFIDAAYQCHTQPAEGRRAFDVPALNGKCKTYIEGLRYIPAGESWEKEEGEVFAGEALFPWKDSQFLETAQGAYEDALAEMQPQLDDIFVALVEV